MERPSTTEDGGGKVIEITLAKEIENLHRHREDFIVPPLGPIFALSFHPALWGSTTIASFWNCTPFQIPLSECL